MLTRAQQIGLKAALGVLFYGVLTLGPVQGQRTTPARPRVILPRTNPFANYPLTPYIGVGQAAAILNTFAYASLFGAPPPGYNSVANFPLTPYIGVGQAAGIISALGGGFAGYPFGAPGFNPFLATGVGYPAWAGYGGYGPGGYGGYGPGGYGGYGPGGYGGTGSAASISSMKNQEATMATAAPQPASALAALRGHGWGLSWPLGLRELPPKEESKELRKQIDDVVETMFREKGGPEGTPQLLKELSKDFAKLNRMYQAHVWDMALTEQQEADVRRFFRKVKEGLLAAEDGARRYDAQLKTTAGGSGQPSYQGGGGQPQQGSGIQPPMQQGTPPQQATTPNMPKPNQPPPKKKQ